ncbi:Hypothetical predicted protein [Podarcis lilfordi]|uniref:Uncharacterized protein n=1 Tax=Podarcis lilfordi TaxID=74358 RepID=A0AA35K4V6_9SAUR|nr:Hypothetical predicted protein [Podarcis lilfordi]
MAMTGQLPICAVLAPSIPASTLCSEWQLSDELWFNGQSPLPWGGGIRDGMEPMEVLVPEASFWLHVRCLQNLKSNEEQAQGGKRWDQLSCDIPRSLVLSWFQRREFQKPGRVEEFLRRGTWCQALPGFEEQQSCFSSCFAS